MKHGKEINSGTKGLYLVPLDETHVGIHYMILVIFKLEICENTMLWESNNISQNVDRRAFQTQGAVWIKLTRNKTTGSFRGAEVQTGVRKTEFK